MVRSALDVLILAHVHALDICMYSYIFECMVEDSILGCCCHLNGHFQVLSDAPAGERREHVSPMLAI